MFKLQEHIEIVKQEWEKTQEELCDRQDTINELNKQINKLNLLQLEINDYNKLINNLNEQNELKDKKINELNDELNNLNKVNKENNEKLIEFNEILNELNKLKLDNNNLLNKFNNLQQDYDTYKLKAQQALKQKKIIDTNLNNSINSTTLEIIKEDEQLKKYYENEINELNIKLNNLNNQINLLLKENQMLKNEYESLLDKFKKQSIDLRKKDNEFKIKIDEINFLLNKQQQQQQQKQQEELNKSQKQKPKLDIKIIDSIDIIDNNNQYESNITYSASRSPQATVSTPIAKKRSSLIDQFNDLLNNDYNELNDNHNKEIKEEILKLKLKINYLTEILNESELNNQRLEEQCLLFKQEIRRLENNNERDLELNKNMEYLKNIILKYLQFNSLDNRLQLLPILTQLLKLNNDEKNLLLKNIQQSNTINNNTTTTTPTQTTTDDNVTTTNNNNSLFSNYLNKLSLNFS